MSTNSKKTKEYFLGLSKKIFLTPDSSVLEDCVFILEEMNEDLESLKAINVDWVPLHYNRQEFFLTPDNFPEVNREVESRELINSLTKSYEFTHVNKEKDC